MDPLWSETCWSTFKYFIILIVSTYYILCVSWIIKCLIIIDERCEHEDWSTWILKTKSSTIQPRAPAPTLKLLLFRGLQASLVERETTRGHEKNRLAVGAAAAGLQLHTSSFFMPFSFLPYLRIPAADTRLSNSGEEAGCISRTNLQQSVIK